MLEAIVALALIAATGLALFSWVDTNLVEASRARERDLAAQLKTDAVEFVGPINPFEQPRGSVRLSPGVSLSWDTTPQGPASPGAGFAGVATGYEFQLFDANVSARDERSGAQANFALTLLGYRRSGGATASN